MTDPPAGETPAGEMPDAERKAPRESAPAKRKAPRAAGAGAAKKPPRAARAPAKKAPSRASARRPSGATERDPVQAVVFSLGGDEYALPIGQVQEVVGYVEPRAIASRVSWVRGVINLRGTILPVCDLAARLGRAGDGARERRIVVVHSDEGAAGLIVGDVREVVTIAPDQLHEAKVTSDPAVTAIAQIGERLVVLLDASAALAGAELRGAAR